MGLSRGDRNGDVTVDVNKQRFTVLAVINNSYNINNTSLKSQSGLE